MKGLKVRRARISDAAVIARQRAGMWGDLARLRPGVSAELERRTRARLRLEIPRGAYLGWLAEAEGVVIGGVGVIPRRKLPSSRSPGGGMEAYVLNVFVETSWRRRGAARALMKAVLSWCRGRGILVVSLHSSTARARALYGKLGFKPTTDEMRLLL